MKTKNNRKSIELRRKRRAIYRQTKLIAEKDDSIKNLQNGLNKVKAELFKRKKSIIQVPVKRFLGSQRRQTSVMNAVPKATAGKVSGYSSSRQAVIDNLSSVPSIQNDLLHVTDKILGQGQFGTVKVEKFTLINLNVAVKCIDKLYSSRKALYTEAIVMLSLSGHSCFPFCFGVVNESAIIMELFAVPTVSGWDKDLTLFAAFKLKSIPFKDFCKTLEKLLSGFIHMHAKNILHNDIKANNVVLSSSDRVVIIDFGKACLMSHPLTYNITPGSPEATQYNTHHRHLAHELRNTPGSKQSVLTDTYSIGHMIKHLCPFVAHSQKLLELASNLKSIEAKTRLTLTKALYLIKNIERNS